MDGQWMNDGRRDGRMDRWMEECRHGEMDRRMDGWYTLYNIKIYVIKIII